MSLFHSRVIEKHIKHIEDISAEQTTILNSWSENLENGVYDVETQHDGEFIQRILIGILGYTGSIEGQSWTIAKNEPVGKGNVDVALGSFTTKNRNIIAPFELKGAKTKDLDSVMSGRNKTPVQQAWEYAMDAKGAQWVLVSNYREIRFYAVGHGRKDYEVFDLSEVDQPHEVARMRLLLSADNLLGGNTRLLLKESEEVDKSITKQLYADYKELRGNLIHSIKSDNPEQDPLSIIRFSQTILDRILFIAFAEDKGLLPKNTLKEVYETKNQYNPQPVWGNFKGLFHAINVGSSDLNIPAYNGGLFAEDVYLDSLNISDELCEAFKKIGDYDFDSDVSVNILGHIFEQSISDLEELKANAESVEETSKKQSKRKKDGIFYTPPYITRYIVDEAVGGWLRDRKSELGFDKLPSLSDKDYDSIKVMKSGKRRGQITYNKKIERHIHTWEAYRNILSNIKVLDPACGSGAFLNEVFDYLKTEGESVNGELAILKGEQTALFRWDTHILANNIFGVDINRESVEITKLSLWLKTANKQEKLTYLEDNIRVGNSLIDSPEIAGELAFDWNIEFSEIMQDGGFDVVVGNPPYIDSEEMAKSQPKARDYIASTFSTTKGNWDIYIAFFELAFILLKEKNGYLSFITPDKWVSKDFGDQFRITYAPFIQKVLVLGRDVFEEAKVDSIVTTFKNAQSASIQASIYDGSHEELLNNINIKELSSPYKLDELFSLHYPLIRKIELTSKTTLSSVLECENACATSDAYELKNILIDREEESKNKSFYRVCNTGTLDKYVFKWGRKPMRYLKHSYLFPSVDKTMFHKSFGATYVARAKSPKIIIKGLTLLDCALDMEGDYIPGKSTLIIKSDDVDKLKAITAFMNSKLVIFYIKQKYASSSYNGGINFTKDMINNLPFPKKADLKKLCAHAEKSIESRNLLSEHSSNFLTLLADQFEFDEVPTNLEFWYNYTFKAFYAKVEKRAKSNKLSLTQKSEWIQYFDKEKYIALELKKTSNEVDQKIDQLIYKLYKLNPEEVGLIEQTS